MPVTKEDLRAAVLFLDMHGIHDRLTLQKFLTTEVQMFKSLKPGMNPKNNLLSYLVILNRIIPGIYEYLEWDLFQLQERVERVPDDLYIANLDVSDIYDGPHKIREYVQELAVPAGLNFSV